MESMADLGTPLFVHAEGVRIRYVRSSSDCGGTPVLLVSPFPESFDSGRIRDDDTDYLDRIRKRGRHCWCCRVQQVKRPDLDANPDVSGHGIGTVLSSAVDHRGAVHRWHKARALRTAQSNRRQTIRGRRRPTTAHG